MVKRINFFREQVIGLSYRKMALITLGIFALMVLLVLGQYGRAWFSEHQLEATKKKIEVIKSQHGLKTASAATPINPVEAVTLALAQEPAWPDALKVVARALSPGIWLESIVADSPADGPQLTIQGTAYQARLVPGFLDRLRSFNAFSKINLISSEAIENKVDAPLRFKILAKTKEQRGAH